MKFKQTQTNTNTNTKQTHNQMDALLLVIVILIWVVIVVVVVVGCSLLLEFTCGQWILESLQKLQTQSRTQAQDPVQFETVSYVHI